MRYRRISSQRDRLQRLSSRQYSAGPALKEVAPAIEVKLKVSPLNVDFEGSQQVGCPDVATSVDALRVPKSAVSKDQSGLFDICLSCPY